MFMPNFVNIEQIFQVTDSDLFQSKESVSYSVATCLERSLSLSGHEHNIHVGKDLASIFFWSRRHPSHWLSSKRPNYQLGALLISAGAIEGHFEGTARTERSPMWSCSCTTMLLLTGHLQLSRNRPTWASNVFVTHPVLRNWPRRTTTCSLDWKKKLKGRHFSSEAEVVVPAETWLDGRLSDFFWVACRS